MLHALLPSQDLTKTLSKQYVMPLFVAAALLVNPLSIDAAKASFLQNYIMSSKVTESRDIHFNPAVYAGVQQFYAQRNFEPVWISEETGLSPMANVIVSELKKSWQHGLHPDKYLKSDIMGANYSRRRSVRARSEFLLSYGLALYAHDMTSMRVEPRSIGQRSEYWRDPVNVTSVLKRFSSSASPDELYRAMIKVAPQNGLYNRLKSEYVRLVTSGDIHKDQVVVELKGLIRPGQSHRSIAKFRERMELPKLKGMQNYVYDDALAAAIKNFQKNNGLKTDGMLGPQTVKYLNRTARGRADQLLANMERMRWLEPNKPSRYIEVNIPSMSLWAFDNGKPALSMPVVVGRVGRQTKSFKAEVTGVRINPRWVVPHRIRTQDFWPDMKEDPTVLAEKQIDVVEGFGREAIYHDPTVIDWKNMSHREFNKYRLIQKPGNHNALGRIRVLMPNDHTIFLHDTNHPEVFEKDYRAASSGCVRLKYPEKLAEFILKGHDVEWGSERMDTIYSSLKPKDLRIENTLPVYILYQTNWLNSKGKIVFGPDLYKRDKKLITALKAQGDYYIPDAAQPLDDAIRLASRTEN